MILSMELSFWHKLGLSFVVGSAWVTISTIAAERCLYSRAGLACGTILTLLCSTCAGFLTYLFIRTRLT